ncbi:MAG: GDP-mannose 4,6-dehydratase [Chloroflexi bacterium RBG_16_56_11]|nr:MAG: GDP-mannose 4,6-dehydratase [Chloroflexi bacterium RBG_16_56_11]
MKKVVVTGGAGFIGSHLAEDLYGRGYRVFIIDNLSTGKLSNIKSLLDSGAVELVKGSITNLALLRKLFAGAEYVFHQAALPSVPRSIKDPVSSHRVNATGTLNVLIAARDCGVKKVVYASSSSVYGDTPTLPKSEDMIPSPLSPYAVTKLAAEHYCRIFERVYGLKTVCLRYFNVYGPRQDPDSPYAAVIPLFFRLVMEGKSPVIYGDGEQSRDFTFVRDAARANILAAESEATGVFNLGSNRRVTISELARLIIGLAGDKSIAPEYRAPRPGDIKHSLADISRAMAFGYRPEYSLEKGLGEIYRSLNKR